MYHSNSFNDLCFEMILAANTGDEFKIYLVYIMSMKL